MAKHYSTLAEYPGPNVKQTHQWATFLIDRLTQFKVHEGRGHALNAIKDSNAAILYKWDETTHLWTEVLRIEEDPNEEKSCDNCDWKHGEEYDDGGRIRHCYTHRVWINMKAEVPTLARLCYDCDRTAQKSKVKKGT